MGTYDLSLADQGEPAASTSSESNSAPGLSGAYSSGQGCAGTTTLAPAEAL